MPSDFFISDHHFGHKLIIDFESRPFADADEMTDVMIQKWNAAVGSEDKVFHLGDFSFLNQERTQEIVRKLNGYKFLVLGNHDRGRSRSWWLDAGFDEVSEYPVLYKDFFLLSHEPVYMNKHMPYVNVHGHIHGQKYEGKNYFNVCVEHWDYIPLTFEQIRDAVVVSEEQA
ncbi:phosphoesterase [Paenibacillus chitinolyticus]|uniref:Phosphoesterase n=1 Tax=Paenibacillus chitinolyticus TaxID=79263 RepID=A0A410WW11_9BACL|nr:metallophosphoesterase [Paenibacillus chitinolyticus]MCY9589187.1 metallophosphoesterase [Paenibacillus chitinolyticus]MCY9594260.1 metallophosphoesterase [Paenibacillus chitinolyticus]QAV18481.1 phosphoesterase [Paenibacillus chitinolyticus]